MVQTVLDNARGKLTGCLVEGGPTGTVTVAVSINRNGRLASARIITGKFKGTETGACVGKTVKGVKFPAFSGEPMHINLPIKL